MVGSFKNSLSNYLTSSLWIHLASISMSVTGSTTPPMVGSFKNSLSNYLTSSLWIHSSVETNRLVIPITYLTFKDATKEVGVVCLTMQPGMSHNMCLVETSSQRLRLH